MYILGENGAFQNLGLCLNKKCKDADQVEDFLQLCIQMIFYEKISLSGLVPDYIANSSSEIIDTLKTTYNISIIDFQNINNYDSDELIKDVGDVYLSIMDDRLNEYLSIIKNAKGLLPKLNDDTLERIKKFTEAVKTNNIDILYKGDLYQQSTFSTDSSIVKIISYNDEIFKRLVKFSIEYDWNEIMAIQLISDLRVLTNKILANNNGKFYSSAVRRGRKEKIILNKILLSQIEELTTEAGAKYAPYIVMPSIKNYIIEKGKGKPINILKITSELRQRFIPVRDHIKNMNKNDLIHSEQALNEISKKVLEEADIGKRSKSVKVIENIPDLSISSIPKFIKNAIHINRDNKLDLCVSAFTETINEMICNSEGIYEKELLKNCIE